ncbi:MAG: hypothetical protein KDD94_09625, partial [Calditrichaeota bacterium]|nr:hypothetical protein [Calditrichota bacterium]
VEFYINPQGRVIRESVKVAETNIEYADFIECVLKKVKAFRKIPSASKDAKGDYLFEKKWVFNY